MKVDKLTVGKIFDSTETRFDAPLFQRPYVWEEDDNWSPMWEAIRGLAEKRLAAERVRPHFLGAIVLDQLETGTGRINLRQIIDGQQRLTTLQIILAVARDLSRKKSQPKYAQSFEKLTKNDVPLSDEPHDVFKVWPTNADRAEFEEVMNATDKSAVSSINENTNDGSGALLANAYLYFWKNLEDWIEAPNGEITDRIDAFYKVLKDDLLLVVIDLDEQDDAQEIFETLNHLGAPLLTADLVKNYVFRLAQRTGENAEKLYDRYWAEFDVDKGYWRTKIRQGRLKTPRIDLFLHHYLTLRTMSIIDVGQLFSSFKDFVKSPDQSASKQLISFRSYADVYRTFDSSIKGSRESTFFYRLSQLDISTAHPLLLEVFKRFAGPEGCEAREQILLDFESYFVRRTVCELTTKNYNRFFVELIKRLNDQNDFSAAAIRKMLLTESADTSRWPDDDEFSRAWLACKMYRRIKRAKLRMILEALEVELHTKKTEAIALPQDLTIEHLMPRDWTRHWPLPVSGNTEEAGTARDELLHTVGNLTLLTKALNPAVSNGPWPKKRAEILKHSALNLNRTLPEVWEELTIRERSKSLLTVAARLWRRPEAGAATSNSSNDQYIADKRPLLRK
jgi:uncharacterized protein with ParB-like and HNH nuclease domain